jgi:hypothetical protein
VYSIPEGLVARWNVQPPTAKKGATRSVPQTKAAWGVPAAVFLQPWDGDNGFVVPGWLLKSPPSAAAVRKVWSCTSPSIYIYYHCVDRVTLSFIFILLNSARFFGRLQAYRNKSTLSGWGFNICTDSCCSLLPTIIISRQMMCIVFFLDLYALEDYDPSKRLKPLTQWHRFISQKNQLLNHTSVKISKLA